MIPGAAPSLLDLRLVPSALVLWLLAVVGVAADLRAAALLLGAFLAAVALANVTVAAARGTRPAVRPWAGHVVLVLCGAALLLPAVHRHDATRAALDAASAGGARVVLDVTVLSDASAAAGGPSWTRDQLTATARTVPGEMQLGREPRMVPASVRVLLRGTGTPPTAVRPGPRREPCASPRCRTGALCASPAPCGWTDPSCSSGWTR